MDKKIMIVILLAGMVLVAASLHKHQRLFLVEKELSSSPYRHYLADYEASVWRILHEAGLEKAECFALQRCYRQQRLPHAYKSPHISPSIHALIDAVLRDFAIDQTTVHVLEFDDGSPAASNGNTILINPALFARYATRAQRFIIAHEVQHMVYQDIAMEMAMEALLKRQGAMMDQTLPLDPCTVYCRFREMRADFEAAAKSEDYAQGYRDFIITHQALPEYADDTQVLTYPKHHERLAMAESLIRHCA